MSERLIISSNHDRSTIFFCLSVLPVQTKAYMKVPRDHQAALVVAKSGQKRNHAAGCTELHVTSITVVIESKIIESLSSSRLHFIFGLSMENIPNTKLYYVSWVISHPSHLIPNNSYPFHRQTSTSTNFRISTNQAPPFPSHLSSFPQNPSPPTSSPMHPTTNARNRLIKGTLLYFIKTQQLAVFDTLIKNSWVFYYPQSTDYHIITHPYPPNPHRTHL